MSADLLSPSQSTGWLAEKPLPVCSRRRSCSPPPAKRACQYQSKSAPTSPVPSSAFPHTEISSADIWSNSASPNLSWPELATRHKEKTAGRLYRHASQARANSPGLVSATHKDNPANPHDAPQSHSLSIQEDLSSYSRPPSPSVKLPAQISGDEAVQQQSSDTQKLIGAQQKTLSYSSQRTRRNIRIINATFAACEGQLLSDAQSRALAYPVHKISEDAFLVPATHSDFRVLRAIQGRTNADQATTEFEKAARIPGYPTPTSCISVKMGKRQPEIPVSSGNNLPTGSVQANSSNRLKRRSPASVSEDELAGDPGPSHPRVLGRETRPSDRESQDPGSQETDSNGEVWDSEYPDTENRTARFNMEPIQKVADTMTKEWQLKTGGKVVERMFLRRLESDSFNLPSLLASYFICDVDDPVWVSKAYFTKLEIGEIRETAPTVALKSDELPRKEKDFEQILKGLGSTDGPGMDLSNLEDRYDNFMMDFKGKVHRPLLQWIHSCLANFLWYCKKSEKTTGPPEISYAFDIWNITRDRAPIPGTTFWRGERHCEADRQAKNIDHGETRLRRRMGSKMDGILFDNDSGAEYFAVLAAKEQVGAIDDDKSRSDFYNLAKVLGRMLKQLHTLVGNDPDVTAKMRVCGVLEHGRQWTVLMVQLTKGHVTVLRTQPMRDYPSDAEDVEGWTEVIKGVMALRQEIQGLITLVKKNSFAAKTGEPHEPSCLPWPTPTKAKD